MNDYRNLDELKAYLKDAKLVVTGKKIYGIYQDIFPQNTVVLPFGERAKTFSVLKRLLAEMHAREMTAQDTLIAVGGGSVGDVAGFAAAIYHRGIPWINIPTTLLSLADSSVGGKTAIDFLGYKNLVGSYWNPDSRVVCKDFLNTLSKDQLASGLGEIIKTSFLDTNLYETAKNTHKLYDLDKDFLFGAAIEASRVKERIVAEDYRCNGVRNNLNIGHTLGHALEAAYGYEHGIAVCMGMQLAFHMFKETIERGFWEEAMVMCKRLVRVPVFSADKLMSYIKSDKKNRDGEIVLILPVRPGDTVTIKLKEEKFHQLLQKAEEFYKK